jgi:CheY-like chemotaxis protein
MDVPGPMIERSDANEILVVDDAEEMREMAASILEAHGYLVREAENGRDAIAWLRGAPHLPALVLLDLEMPVMDGWEFLHRLRRSARWSEIPVLVMSGVDETRLPRGVPSLPKPSTAQALTHAVDRVSVGAPL